MIRGMLAGLICVVVAVLAAAIAWPPGNSVVEHAMQRYRFVHYAPSRPEVDPTLIVVLHGYGGSAEAIRHSSGMDALARQVRADIVYVQAEPDMYGIPHWNVGLGFSDRNDRDFLAALVRGLQAEFGFAPERSFIVGESNGAYMALGLACEVEDLVAGVVSVIGTMSMPDWENCDPQNPVPVMLIHGAEDDVITAPSLEGEPNLWMSPATPEEIVARWADWNAAHVASTASTVPWARQVDWHDDTGRLGARYLEIAELSHEWPRAQTIGIEGAVEAWRFMAEVMTGN